ncbi:MAG: SH3 domain-containing protein, partial [Caldilinea sp. CFX5]|nr:SH3 domain-containing protein [Caldilinea sp. CFX5]
LKAAIDLQAYDNSWTAPGLFFGVSEDFADSETKDVLDAMDYSEDCGNSERFEYDDSVFVGHYDLWEDCGGNNDTLWVILAAKPKESADYLVLLNVLLPQKADTTALDEIFKSFNVAGSSSSQEDALPTAEVTTNALNIRSGPGTNYERLGSLSNGDQVVVIGQYNNCGWLNVQTRDEVTGWVSGNERYVKLDTDCSAIPEAEAPAPPRNSGSGSQRPSPAAPTSTKGCYLFQNQLGAELNITFTRKGDGWNTTFKVKEDAEVQQCFDPGDYTYTLDAPPPWGSTNGELTINAGDNYTFPIRPE